MVYNIRGIEIKSDLQPEFWKLVEAGKWESFTFDAIDKLCTPGSVFIDIGAWNGVFSVYAEKRGVLVHALEPDPEALKLLNQLQEDNATQAVIHRYGISDTNGAALLQNNSFGNSESSLIDRPGIKGTRKINTTTLPNFCNRFADRSSISLIKIDIEGAEVVVLRQAREWIEEHKPNMHISWHPAYIDSFDDVMYLFDIYDCVSDNGTAVNADNFQETLDAHSHAMIFTAKH